MSNENELMRLIRGSFGRHCLTRRYFRGSNHARDGRRQQYEGYIESLKVSRLLYLLRILQVSESVNSFRELRRILTARQWEV